MSEKPTEPVAMFAGEEESSMRSDRTAMLATGFAVVALLFSLAAVAGLVGRASIDTSGINIQNATIDQRDTGEPGAMVGPGFVDSWTVTCADTATLVVPSGFNVQAFECQAPETGETNATIKVGIGDSGIAAPLFATRNSPIICGSGCAKNSRHINAKQAYCRAEATQTVKLFCWAIVATSTAP